MGDTKEVGEHCPDCGRPLHHVYDYPANELWCIHCGNRYFAHWGPADRAGPESVAGCRVLLLDEVADRRDRLVRHFTRLGYQVTPVCHPRQALEAASFRRFDLMVLPATISEFPCLSFVGKLKHLLGSIKFVIVRKKELLAEEFRDPDVVCADVDDADCRELERAVEQLLEELRAARKRGSSSAVDELIEVA